MSKHSDKQYRKISKISLGFGTLCGTLYEMKAPVHIVTWPFLAGIWCFALRITVAFYCDIERLLPPEKMYDPPIFKKLLRTIYGEKIHKSLFIQICIMMSLFLITTVIVVYTWTSKVYTYVFTIEMICLAISICLIIYVYYAMYFTIFLERFKRLNKHNIKYALFFTTSNVNKWPNSKKLGVCNVVEHCEKKNKTYATVKMLDTGEVYQEVLAISEITSNSRKKYKLYEICNERYITL